MAHAPYASFSSVPPKQGMYDPANEKDACGLAMVATLTGEASHSIIDAALGSLRNLEHRGAILNLYDTTLTYEGKKIDLTKNEFRILQTLMENKGRLVSRDTLMTKLWETDDYIEENTLTVNIARLRKKLDKAGLTDFITTKVGEGYLIPQAQDPVKTDA